MSTTFIFSLVGFLGGWVATRGAITLALRLNVRDLPDYRSSHTIPTPRLGGIGIAVPFLFFLVFFQLYGTYVGKNPPLDFFYSILIGGSGCFVFGLIDDLHGLRAGVKLGLQIMCAIVPVAFGMRIVSIARFAGLTFSPFTGGLLAFCWILLIINAYNFMDGMDGMAGSFAAVVGLFVSVLIGKGISDIIPVSLIFLVGVCIGFLIFNLTPAKTFMGDCGSQFLGYTLAVIPLYVHTHDPVCYPFGAFVILLMPFLYDVLYTLARRILRRENIFKAHRTHLYQRLLIAGWSHPAVLRVVFITYILCGILALGFANTKILRLRILFTSLALVVMFLYTVFVWEGEKIRARAGVETTKS